MVEATDTLTPLVEPRTYTVSGDSRASSCRVADGSVSRAVSRTGAFKRLARAPAASRVVTALALVTTTARAEGQYARDAAVATSTGVAAPMRRVVASNVYVVVAAGDRETTTLDCTHGTN